MDRRPPKRPHDKFSIANLLSSDAAPARKRFSVESLLSSDRAPPSFFIEQLLQTGEGSSSRSQQQHKEPEQYVRKLGEADIERNNKFKFGRMSNAFVIEDVPADAEGLLAGIFQYCIDEALEAHRAIRGSDATHTCCKITRLAPRCAPSTRTWLKHCSTCSGRYLFSAYPPPHSLKIIQAAQSKKKEGVTLWGAPFNVSVITVSRTDLPDKRVVEGSGRRRTLAPVHHRISEQGLIKVFVNKKMIIKLLHNNALYR